MNQESVPDITRFKHITDAYVHLDGCLGALLIGSSVRPFKDTLSDIDIEFIFRDDVLLPPVNERLVRAVVDDEVLELSLHCASEFLARRNSALDVDHGPYQECVIFYDPQNFIEENLVSIQIVPESVRSERLKIHYYEFLLYLNRSKRCLGRAHKFNARHSANMMINTYINIIFLNAWRWPPQSHWVLQELELLQSDRYVIKLIESILIDPQLHDLEILRSSCETIIRNTDLELFSSKDELTAAVSSYEMRSLREKYGFL